MSVKVTKVTVEAMKDGKKFTVELDPEISAIVVNRVDLRKAQTGGFKKTTGDKTFNASKGFPKDAGIKQVVPESQLPMEILANDGDPFGFWWHQNGTWFHAQ